MAETGQYGKHRFWEIIPGFLIWTTFVAAIGASFFAPTIAVIFIILFDLYWTLRVLYFIIHVFAAYKEYRRVLKVDWEEEIKEIPDWERLYHVIMLPTFREDVTILRHSLEALCKNHYRKDRFIVVLGGEEGDQENFLRAKKVLETEFAGKFADLIFTIHPRGLANEIPGKGSNLHWMATQIRKKIDTLGIPYHHILVSAFDVDTIAHEQYFARLSWLFLTIPDPLHTSYQPLNLFSNNIWHATAPVRVSAFGTTFWLLTDLVRPERLWTFSSHSMPWQMLVDVGYWESNMVSEDSRIFMQGFIRYDGNYRVTSLFLPVHMDAVEGDGYWDSLKSLYKQQRRWAWGVEHFPYMLEKFRENPRIPKKLKWKFIFNHMEGMYTWATAPILIFVLGYLPFYVHGAERATALFTNSPFTLERMMQVATAGVFVSGILSFLFLPPRPKDIKFWTWVIMIVQWVMLPVTFIIFGAFPAIDAQTRMMLGKYLGFNVTKKAAK
ncbi:MAG: glycosyltransferase family 2 protein [Patescibacteria group bacterium]|jgi:cellulose synthase/poly-beta-1,6-N-acetylglucosamine synthase-like glycosyltransferase